MPPRSHFPFIGLLSSLLAALLTVSVLGGVARADDTYPAAPAGTAVPVDIDDTVAQATAEHALETVQDIVDTAPGAAPSDATTGADLTMALRDLGYDGISREAILEKFRAAEEAPSFFGHPYTCDGTALPRSEEHTSELQSH